MEEPANIQLVEYLEHNHFFLNLQFGYRKHHSKASLSG